MKLLSVQFSLSSVVSSISLFLSSTPSPHQTYYCVLFTEKLVGTKKYDTECFMCCVADQVLITCRILSLRLEKYSVHKKLLRENKYPILLPFLIMNGSSKIHILFICFINYRQITTFLTIVRCYKRLGLQWGYMFRPHRAILRPLGNVQKHKTALWGWPCVAATCSPFDKPLVTAYYSKESCDLTVINKAYIVTLHNRMDTIKYQIYIFCLFQTSRKAKQIKMQLYE
jgi:hypothetical protein